jgi:membrane associated rhomboid family serine protease
VLCRVGQVSPKVLSALSLQTGDGLHPYQWVTVNFVHADPFHLIVNLAALWTFGFLVEGKIGWYKSLAIYLGIGVAQSAVVQMLFLGAAKGSMCGASPIVFGMMGMCLVWGPENKVIFVGVRWWVFMHNFSVRIKYLVAVVVGLQITVASALNLALRSVPGHLLGAAAGLGIGIWMLKTGRVECENWDVFSVEAGRHEMTEEQLEKDKLRDPAYRRHREEQLEGRRQELLEKFRTLVRDGHPAVAWAAYERMTKDQAEVVLPEADLCALIAAFHKCGLWAESIPAMAQYLVRFSGQAQTLPMRIELARILVMANRPMQAMRVMAKIREASLPAKVRATVAELRAEAVKRHEEDPYEVADEDW